MARAPKTHEQLRTPKEACEVLGLLHDDGQPKLQTLADWRYRGEGPSYRKLGKFVRYSDSDLTEFIESRRVVARPAAERREEATG